MSQAGPWHVEHLRGDPGEIHAREVPPDTPASVWVVQADHPALVLGSAQRDSDVDRLAARSAGLAVVRRRSGGGAVLVDPTDLVWLDVIVPRGHPLWDDDIGRSGLWLGSVWSRALGSLGVGTDMYVGPMAPDPLARHVCFVGRAAPELTVGDRKVLGVAQRRTRAAARFQCAALLRWEPARLVELLAPVLTDDDVPRVSAAGVGIAAIEPAIDADAVVEAFLRELTVPS